MKESISSPFFMENFNNNIDPGFEMYTPFGTTVPEGLPGTPFFQIYCSFLNNITDDMYMELTYEDTFKILEKMLMQAMSMFKWPKFPKYAYDRTMVTMIEEVQVEGGGVEEKILSTGCWTVQLTLEEVDILTDLMMLKWVDAQLFSVNNTKMKYSSSDFKFTSQANHISKLGTMKKDFEKSVKEKQSLYRRQTIDRYGNVTADYSGLSTSKGKERGEDWWNFCKRNTQQECPDRQCIDI